MLCTASLLDLFAYSYDDICLCRKAKGLVNKVVEDAGGQTTLMSVSFLPFPLCEHTRGVLISVIVSMYLIIYAVSLL